LSLASLLVAEEPLIDPAEEPTTRPGDDEQLRRWREELARVEATLAAPLPQTSAPVERPRRAAPLGEERAATPATRAESRRRRAGANDPVLRRMEGELGYKVRHRNAALGGGLAKEAAKVDAEIVELSARLAIARELVGAGLPDGQTGELQRLIDERLGGARGDAGQAGEGVNARAEAVRVDAAAAKAARDATERRSAELRENIAAREAALAAERELERQAAETAVAVQDAAQPAAAREAAVQDAAAQEAPGPEAEPAGQNANASREKLEAALAAAVEREGEAAAAANGVAENVRRIEADLADARRAETELAQVMRDLSALEPQHAKQLRAVEELRKEQTTAVVPIEPGADAVTSAVGEDHRYLWMLIAGGAIIVLFSFLMWQSAHGGQALVIPDRENPFEAPVVGAPVPPADPNPDDERPLAV
jgi:hypothetical protein